MRNENETLIQMSVPNGIGLNVPAPIRSIVNKAIAMAIEVMKQIGLTVGASDLQIHGVNGRCAHCEVKTSTGVQSEDQIKFQKRIETLGGKYYLLRSVSDINQIDFDWLFGLK